IKTQFYWRKIKKISQNSIIFIQYPLQVKFDNSNKVLVYNYFLKKLYSRFRVIILIHDLSDLRGDSKHDSYLDLKNAYYIICHNMAMKSYLENKGIKSSKLISLQIFDYLASKENISNHYKDKATLCFAGNLQKSQFIYNLPLSVRKLGINLYGNGYTGKIEGIHYLGTFGSEKISSVIRGKFGLVWDGKDYKKCVGKIGNYLRYNNPHKISMYLVANMPVIIWSKAAEANFVKENNIGILVDSLDELPNILNNLTEKKYEVMLENVKKIKSLLQKGNYLTSALDNIKL
ncbi:glycosyl transferase, partial [Lactobacillus amylovorus]|uniref:glycosyl transferase n=2 Tax=Lactobacillus amylovorus TaxID=1604 RepID=UPI001651B4A9